MSTTQEEPTPLDEQDRTGKGRLRRMAPDTRPLALPTFRRVFLGQGASSIGTMLTRVAVSVQIYSLSHSSLYVGLAGICGFAPLVVFGLYGGAVADRVDRRVLYLWSSLATWAVTLLLLVQTMLGVGSAALILVLVAIQGGGFAVSSSTRGAIIPGIVPAPLIPAANTLNYAAGTLGDVLGPLLAGILVALPHGFGLAYGADALLFLASLHSTFRLPALKPAAPAATSAVRSIAQGLRFIGGNPVLLMSFGVDIAAMVLAMPEALFPQVADTRFHGGVGPLYSAVAIGSVLAALLGGWIGRVRRQGVVLTCAVLGWALAIAFAGWSPTLWGAVVLLAVAGAADLVSAVIRQTLLQTYAADGMRGRLQGVHTVVVSGGPRLGDLRAGAMAAATTMSLAWSGSALLCAVLVAVAASCVRPFWQYDAAAAEGPPAP
ncbi:MFS transporter [Actinacidiphila guanduensis]|uniref:Transmembrane secretion effector n=1 Tax=Actinacidiphila guanduensis TaxID=310781 RepID=A0A1H0B7W9_9ACTN|nr:MFS transporter [Actinacidiphila guanduensis]SDN41423.1 Transmembrane secretion effector [Actinacidiphila guanduensis]